MRFSGKKFYIVLLLFLHIFKSTFFFFKIQVRKKLSLKHILTFLFRWNKRPSVGQKLDACHVLLPGRKLLLSE